MSPPYPPHRLKLLEIEGPGQLLIHEIYLSIQGESTFAGLPCVFVRTAVCDCGARGATPRTRSTEGDADDPRRRCCDRRSAFDCPLVELTGGEPLLKPDVLPLMTELCDAGQDGAARNQRGGRRRPRRPARSHHHGPEVPGQRRVRTATGGRTSTHLKPTDEIKFVIASRRDWDWTARRSATHRLDERFTVPVERRVRRRYDRSNWSAWLLEAGCTRADAAPDAQVHLGPEGPRGLTPFESARWPP